MTIDLSALRQRWPEVRRTSTGDLRVALLSTYTVDPLVPYLGAHLETFAPAIQVGPVGQVLQECLRTDSVTAAFAPDVLVVAPRFEDYQTDDAAETELDIIRSVDAAIDAAGRWRCCLALILPAGPRHRPLGIGDDGAITGLAATTTAVRQRLRASLADFANGFVVDMLEVLASIGEDRAYAPAMFRFARVPYSELTFACLGQRIARLLRLRAAGPVGAVVLDADSLLLAGTPPRADDRIDADELLDVLAGLRRSGILVGLRSGHPPAPAWAALASAWPDLAADVLDACAVDDRLLPDQLAALSAELRLSPECVVLLTGAETSTWDLPGGALVLPARPDDWYPHLRDHGVFDRLSALDTTTPGPATGYRAPLSLEDYVTSLEVRVTCRPATADELDTLSDLAGRAKDFTLGHEVTPAQFRAWHADAGGDLLAVEVSDRLGSYGVSGVLRLRYDGRVCRVDLFSVSCPVLGKDVEEVILRQAVRRAADHRCTELVLPYRETGRNAVAVNLLARAVAAEPGSDEVRIVAQLGSWRADGADTFDGRGRGDCGAQ